MPKMTFFREMFRPCKGTHHWNYDEFEQKAPMVPPLISNFLRPQNGEYRGENVKNAVFLQIASPWAQNEKIAKFYKKLKNPKKSLFCSFSA